MLLAPVTLILIYSLWLSWKSINNCSWNLIPELHIRRGWYSHVSGERPQNSLAPQTKSIGYLFKGEKTKQAKNPKQNSLLQEDFKTYRNYFDLNYNSALVK